MAIEKPYPRIYLPQNSNRFDMDDIAYCSDARYVDGGEAASLINGARIIIKDYLDLIDYIEPSDANKNAYSHRIYELLLRVATEFEANCKGILEANGYVAHGNMSILDYHKLNALMKLDQYELETRLWTPSKTTKPLAEWTAGHTLTWYQAYNHSKHNRYTHFSEATFEQLFDGIGSLVVILAAQFPNMIGFIGNVSGFTCTSENNDTVMIDHFTIKYPTFSEAECYDFDWDKLSSSDPNPFEKYSF